MLLLAALLAAAAPPPSPDAIAAAAPASVWREIPPDDLLLVDTPIGRMTIQLAPEFAPQHVAAIRALARSGRFDGGSIVRVQDNYVVQWAAPPQDASGAQTLPPDRRPPRIRPRLPAEYERPAQGVTFTPLGHPDSYAETGFVAGWPAARDRKAGTVWLTHCYGTVGAGRDMPPDTGDGSELYAVIGHAPRHLDRNIANVGRVIGGIEPYAALPRGRGELGFYIDGQAKVPLVRVRLATDVPDPPRWQVMDTTSAVFADYVRARANRTGFFVRPAGTVDICNVRVPVRPLP